MTPEQRLAELRAQPAIRRSAISIQVEAQLERHIREAETEVTRRRIALLTPDIFRGRWRCLDDEAQTPLGEGLRSRTIGRRRFDLGVEGDEDIVLVWFDRAAYEADPNPAKVEINHAVALTFEKWPNMAVWGAPSANAARVVCAVARE